MWHVWGTAEIDTRFCLEELKTRDDFEDLRVDESMRVKWALQKWNGRTCLGLLWLRIKAIGWGL
jgi:hypothetical protein